MKLDRLIEKIDARIARMNSLAAGKWHFDYQILPGNNDRDIRKLKNDLRRLGDSMVAVAGDIGLSLTAGEVSDSGENRL
jgi:putative iron-regulated protein